MAKRNNTLEKTINECIIHTPSAFAKQNLIHLQETGWLTVLTTDVAKRDSIDSYLFFTVVSGSGELKYGNDVYPLNKGDCVFIDCNNPYQHKSSDDLWTLKWVHFFGPNMKEMYEKYVDKGGSPVFTPKDTDKYIYLMDDIYSIANSADAIRDMKICERLYSLLTHLMEDTSSPEPTHKRTRHRDMDVVISYLDENFKRKVSLEELADKFFINKFYLTRLFKEHTGQTINEYIINKRITYAKSLLRFTGKSLEEIGEESGIGDAGYFSKTFTRIEGINPKDYRKLWR